MKLYICNFLQPPVASSLSGKNNVCNLYARHLVRILPVISETKLRSNAKRPLNFRKHLLHMLLGLSQNVKIGGFFENRQLFRRHSRSCNRQKIMFPMCLMNAFQSFLCAAVCRGCLFYCSAGNSDKDESVQRMLLRQGVIILHDNGGPHSANRTCN